jgi:hypothetical protein
MHLSVRRTTLPVSRHPSLGTFGSNTSDDWAPLWLQSVSKHYVSGPQPWQTVQATLQHSAVTNIAVPRLLSSHSLRLHDSSSACATHFTCMPSSSAAAFSLLDQIVCDAHIFRWMSLVSCWGRLLRVPKCGGLSFTASCGHCDLPQLMHACHCGHMNRAPSAMLCPRLPVAAAGSLQHGGSVHDSGTVRSASSSASAQRDSRRRTGCRTTYRRAAEAVMHNTVRGGLCKGAPLDTRQPSTTNIRWRPAHARS